jgi:hypothetical protein
MYETGRGISMGLGLAILQGHGKHKPSSISKEE